MPIDITINAVTGATPCQVYICDNPITTCFWISNISSFPYTFSVPSILDTQTDFTLKIVDDNGCVITTILTP